MHPARMVTAEAAGARPAQAAPGAREAPAAKVGPAARVALAAKVGPAALAAEAAKVGPAALAAEAAPVACSDTTATEVTGERSALASGVQGAPRAT
ncbi:hypothetical protein WMF37_48270 [Sorangium sp. So ce291]|uniref:hypothetical protein n=1 Tax=Sorangium sp. So ce291 TaxID=3133294 RepID=UPI003F5F0507